MSQFTKIYDCIFSLDLTDAEFKIFVYLLSKSKFKDSKNFRTHKTIGTDCNISYSHTRACLKSLGEKGLLKIKSGQLKHKSNIYEPNQDYLMVAMAHDQIRGYEEFYGDNFPQNLAGVFQKVADVIETKEDTLLFIQKAFEETGMSLVECPWDVFCSALNPILHDRLGSDEYDARDYLAKTFKVGPRIGRKTNRTYDPVCCFRNIYNKKPPCFETSEIAV